MGIFTLENATFVFLLALILLQACDEIDPPISTCENCNFTCIDANESDVMTNNCIDNWECDFKVIPQSKVDISEFEGHKSGDKNVFKMKTSTQGDSMIADDEYTHILVMELDKTQNSFSVESSELANMNVHFKRVCFCSVVEFQALNAGCIQGEKQSDGTWFIQGNLTIPYSFGDIDVKLDAQFAN